VRPCRAVALAIVCALAWAAAGCGDEPAAAGPNVLIVTLDTLRADRLGVGGQTARSITPRLDELARQSVAFTQAFATSSFTPPTHASILTGLQPSEHDMRWWNKPLADVPTAAEIFRAAGYRTGAFTPMPSLLKLGLERGFDQATAPEAGEVQTPDGEQILIAGADAVSSAALPWLTAPDERPFFAWVHFYDAHRPYGRQGPEWSGRFRAPGTDDPAVGATERWYQLDPAERAAMGLTPEQTTLIKDHYDGGAAFLDDRVGKLLDDLSAAGLLEHTIVVLIADHGEVLDEHEAEWFSHDPWLVDENVRVPFLLRLPGAAHAGLRVESQVSQVDVLPTLLALTGVRPSGGPALVVSGLDLTPALEGRKLPRAVVYADRQGDDRDGKTGQRTRMLRSESLKRKLIHEEDADRFVLWATDAEDDGRDLSEAEPDVRKALIEAYVSLREHLHPPGQSTGAGDIDPALVEQLRALGYIQ
jgi:arylsulfatase A-like enzyme